MNDHVERELKLRPEDGSLLEQLAGRQQLGPFTASQWRRERQRNSFFDTPDGSLRAAGIAFRRRTIEGARLARWTLKGEGSQVAGIAERTEIEVQLDPDTAPALAIGVLRQAARDRGARPLAEQLADALASGGLPRAVPYLETLTDRRLADLSAAATGWQVELALDEVWLVGHPGFHELEIEAELKRGDDAALEAARQAIAQLGPVHDAQGSKLSRAVAHLAACRVPSGINPHPPSPSPDLRGRGC